MKAFTSHAVIAAMLIATPAALAQESGQSADDIARKLADPGAPMISVPLQYNYLGEVGPGGDAHNQQLKVQPVIPFVGENGKFILRPILPYQWNQFPDSKTGLGDLFVQGYYIPSHAGKASPTEIGFGGAVLFDTASHSGLGTGKYSLGPTFVLVHKTGKWTVGALANHVWSVAGDSDREDVSQTALQPFFNRQLSNGWSLGITSESTYNWKADSRDAWTVPIGGTVSKVVKIGAMPVSFSLGGFYNVDRPEFANRWTARASVTFVITE